MVTSTDVSKARDAISALKLDVSCNLCGWKDSLNAGWIGAQRDMRCPDCRGTIVLNTSVLRDRVAHLRRQINQLCLLLASPISNAEFKPRVAAGHLPVPDLAIAHVSDSKHDSRTIEGSSISDRPHSG